MNTQFQRDIHLLTKWLLTIRKKKKVVEIDVMIKSIFCDENIPYIRFFIACHKICQNGKIYVAFSISVSHFLRF